MQAQAGCTEYNPVRRRADWFVYFGVSTFKGLLSIPCDGRGARRPQGQSFRKSVGPRPCLYLDDDDKNCQQRNYSCMITRLACLTILRNVKTSEISLTNQ